MTDEREETIAWAAREAYVDWGVRSDRDEWVHHAITRAARLAAERIEARVRAEVAEELAWIFEKRAAQEQGPFERRDPAAVAFLEAARTARSRAGSPRDTTPEGGDA